jgi:hypothetical protein
MISAGSIVDRGEHCCLLQWGVHRAAVLCAHEEEASPEATAEAMTLLGFEHGKCVLKEFDSIAGHWGIEAIPAGEIATIGRSQARGE